MTEIIKLALARQLQELPENINDGMLDEVYDLLSNLKEVQRELIYSARWWDEYRIVVELEPSLFISYVAARTTGDRSPYDVGWENPSISHLKQVYPTTVTVTKYA